MAHVVALSLSYAVGQPTGQFFLNPAALFAPVPGAAFGLPVVYACWAVAIVLVFPLCAWFAGVKQRRRDPWLSYL
jgi:hypothetical protein